MTPTEKKHSKLIGNMYWEDVEHYTYNANGDWVHQQGQQLIMISGVQRGNDWHQYKNEFYFKIDVLQRPFPTNYNKPSFVIRCRSLQDCLDNKTVYHPVDSHEQASV